MATGVGGFGCIFLSTLAAEAVEGTLAEDGAAEVTPGAVLEEELVGTAETPAAFFTSASAGGGEA